MLGEKLRSLRKTRGYTQQQIADYFNVSRGCVSNWEKGKRALDMTQLNQFAKFYNVSLDYFNDEETAKNELLETLARTKTIFENENVPMAEKEELFNEVMKLYLKIKGEKQQ